MRNGTLLIFIMLTGCSKITTKDLKPKCIIHPTSNEINSSKEEKLTFKDLNNTKTIDSIKEADCIVDVFLDSMFSNGDRFKLIKNLDAFGWEKKALNRAYKEHTKLWHTQQKKEFKKILEEDKYLALCGDKRYYDNLLFTIEEPQVDILHSILLLRYINNLSNGCIEWASSNVKNENSIQNIQADYLLKIIEKGALVERLFIPFIPRKKSFLITLREYKKMLEKSKNPQELKVRRIEIEQEKQAEEHPNYNN